GSQPRRGQVAEEQIPLDRCGLSGIVSRLRRQVVFVASSGVPGRGLVRRRTAPFRGPFTLKNALENGHF
ncbi:MAG: hypothetical protein KC587_14295, partial [Nitrospira sp.]|nr:hypothetical protein [Nitrospira sp.]